MADLKISQLTGATTPLAGTEVLPIVQSGTTKQISVENLTAGRNISVLNLAGTQTVGTSLGSGGVYLSGNGGPDTGFVGYNYKNISGTESVPEPARASWREGFLNGASVEWNVSYRAASAAVSSWTKYFGVGSTGNVTVSVGNLIQGTAGKGVNFTANTPAAGMTSQLLNWYEEGSWTPSVYDALTGGNKSATNGGGSYTRIGRQVTVRFNIDDISTAGLTAGNDVCIGNLPFTAGTASMGSFYTYRVGGGTAQSASLTVTTAATRMRIALFSGNSATTDVNIKISDLVTGVSAIYGTLTYFV